MTNRENYLSIARRTGYKKMPVDFPMCPSLANKFQKYLETANLDLPASHSYVCDIMPLCCEAKEFNRYYNHSFKEGTYFDSYGIANEPGSAEAFHMTRMYHPMKDFDSIEQIESYPFPDYLNGDDTQQKNEIQKAHINDLAAIGSMQCTIWETAWYLRGMENLMTDMMMEDKIAECLLDRVTERAICRAESFARNGADILFLGDDIGMQHTVMMSDAMYCTWLKPRLKKVIQAAKKINPKLIVFYHSCGFVTPFIPHLIEAGIDVLDPVQPECMEFAEIHHQFKDQLSFHGTIGTQTTMPFGTPEDVKNMVFRHLEIAGKMGGLYVAPTHLLEPEVPVENVAAYIRACQEFTGSGYSFF